MSCFQQQTEIYHHKKESDCNCKKTISRTLDEETMAGWNCYEAQHCVLTNYGGKLVLGEGTNLVVDTSKCLQLQFIVNNNNGYYGYTCIVECLKTNSN